MGFSVGALIRTNRVLGSLFLKPGSILAIYTILRVRNPPKSSILGIIIKAPIVGSAKE